VTDLSHAGVRRSAHLEHEFIGPIASDHLCLDRPNSETALGWWMYFSLLILAVTGTHQFVPPNPPVPPVRKTRGPPGKDGNRNGFFPGICTRTGSPKAAPAPRRGNVAPYVRSARVRSCAGLSGVPRPPPEEVETIGTAKFTAGFAEGESAESARRATAEGPKTPLLIATLPIIEATGRPGIGTPFPIEFARNAPSRTTFTELAYRN